MKLYWKYRYVNLHFFLSTAYHLSKLLSQGKSSKYLRGKNAPGNIKPGHIVKAIDGHSTSLHQKEALYTSKALQISKLQPKCKIYVATF